MKSKFCNPTVAKNLELPDLHLICSKHAQGLEIDLCGYCPESGYAFDMGYRAYILEYNEWNIRVNKTPNSLPEVLFHLKDSIDTTSYAKRFTTNDLFLLFREIELVLRYLKTQKVTMSPTTKKRAMVYLKVLDRMGIHYELSGFPEFERPTLTIVLN